MTLYELTPNALNRLEDTTFQAEGIRERQDLQALLRDAIDVIDDDIMVLAEEFGDWEESRRRIDLLCLDRNARLVVVELNRTEDGGHMELQAIRYAAMVSKMTFQAAVEAHRSHLRRLDRDECSAEHAILKFLAWNEPREELFANDVRLILVAADVSNELMTTVIWLGQHDIDIRCVKLEPYKYRNRIFIDVQQVFPLPEAADYQIRIKEKERRERPCHHHRDLTRFDLTIGDRILTNLPKLRLALQIVSEAVRRGTPPREAVKNNTAWIAVDGHHDKESFLLREKGGRDQESSPALASSFLTEDDELIFWKGKTYALRGNMWGQNTRDDLDRIIEEFNLDDVRYRVAD